MKIHPVFHVSLLKKTIRSQSVNPHIPANLSFDMELLVEPGTIDGCNKYRSFIRWKRLLVFEDTWESFKDIQPQFLTFNLEDKVVLWAEGNVYAPNLVTYTRKMKRETR